MTATAAQKSPFRYARIAAVTALTFAAVVSRADGDKPLLPANPQVIPDAVAIYLTPRGEKTVSEKLNPLVSEMIRPMKAGEIPAFEYKSPAPIDLEALAKSSPQAAKAIQGLQAAVSGWFMGFELKNPQPNISFKRATYKMDFQSMTLSTDREALKALGRDTGAVVVVEIRIGGIELGADALLVSDTANPDIGEIGALSPSLTVAPGQEALSLRVPVYVTVTPEKAVKLEVLKPSTNFSKSNIGLKHGGFLIPDIAIEINGKKFPLNKERLVKEFDALTPRLLEQVKSTLDQVAQDQIAKIAGQQVGRSAPKEIGQITKMKAPGGQEGDPDFVWGMKVSSLGMSENLLAVKLESFAEDPTVESVPHRKNAGSRGPVSLSGSNPANFDLALSISRGLLNRIVQLSYGRGAFHEVESKPGEKLKIIAPPQLDTYQKYAGRDTTTPYMAIHVRLSSDVDGFLEGILLKSEVVFDIDVIAKMIPAADGEGLQLQLIGVDEETLDLDNDSLSAVGKLFKGQVINGVKKQLRAAVASWEQKPNVLEGVLPLPPKLFNQKTTPYAMRMDKNGYIVMFLNFL